MDTPDGRGLSWVGIIRLGIVQFSLGSIIVLTTSVLNQVVSVEYALPAVAVGLLVAWREVLQFLRPRWGYSSDKGGQRTPFIIGGMVLLALGGVLATFAAGMMDTGPHALFGGAYSGVTVGIILSILAYTLIGLGVGAAGTCLLAVLATTVAPGRRPAGAAIVWFLMIVGFAVTARSASEFLDPYTPLRLVTVCSVVCVCAVLITIAALWGVERANPPYHIRNAGNAPAPAPLAHTPFMDALRQVWSEPRTRYFAIFVFISMLAFEAQQLIMEPFGRRAFGYTLAEVTRLASYQHYGVATGMALVGLLGTAMRGSVLSSFKLWTVLGCAMSAVAHVNMVAAGAFAPHWPLGVSLGFLGFSNGVFAVAAIGSMMMFASQGAHGREGTRMGVWGTAQATAMALGMLIGTIISDSGNLILGDYVPAYQSVFALEAVLFLVAAIMATRIGRFGPVADPAAPTSSSEGQLGPCNAAESELRYDR